MLTDEERINSKISEKGQQEVQAEVAKRKDGAAAVKKDENQDLAKPFKEWVDEEVYVTKLKTGVMFPKIR